MKYFRERSGFTLATVLVTAAIFLILAGAAATHWSFIRKRAKEEELIFRGTQYVRALREYFKKFRAYPNKLEELIDEKCIRKLYPDPMTENGEWDLVRSNSPQGTEAQQTTENKKEESTFMPKDSVFIENTGIIGVRSKSHEKSIKEYNGKRFYHEWVFSAADDKNKGKPEKKAENEPKKGS